MTDFVHNENIALYRRLIAESESAPPRDQGRRAMLLELLAEEVAKQALSTPTITPLDS